jgi:hypothetical protein
MPPAAEPAGDDPFAEPAKPNQQARTERSSSSKKAKQDEPFKVPLAKPFRVSSAPSAGPGPLVIDFRKQAAATAPAKAAPKSTAPTPAAAIAAKQPAANPSDKPSEIDDPFAP